MSDLLCAWWCQSLNVGDRLTPYLIKKITGSDPVYVEPSFNSRHYVFAGSVLNHCGLGAIVWGAGLGTLTDGVNPNIDICAVRGPISRARALSCGNKCRPVYGDPGLALPKVFIPKRERSLGTGVVPHYIDLYRARSWWDEREVISPLQDVESFISEIVQYDRIISSSLHGIVIAHAYGIPAVWVQMSDSVGGDGTKFRDHMMSLGIEASHPFDMRNGRKDVPDQYFSSPRHDKLIEVMEKLWEARPLR